MNTPSSPATLLQMVLMVAGNKRPAQGSSSEEEISKPWCICTHVFIQQAFIYLCFVQMAPVVKNLPAKARRLKRHGFDPWVGKIPWRKTWQPTPVFLPGKSLGQKSLVGCSSWDHKSWPQLNDYHHHHHHHNIWGKYCLLKWVLMKKTN